MNILTTEDLEKTLKINNRRAKALMRTEGFPSIRIGMDYRVEEEALMEWLKTTKTIKLDYSKV